METFAGSQASNAISRPLLCSPRSANSGPLDWFAGTGVGTLQMCHFSYDSIRKRTAHLSLHFRDTTLGLTVPRDFTDMGSLWYGANDSASFLTRDDRVLSWTV